MASIERHDFEFIREFLYRRAAIALEDGKEYLVEARLSPLARAEGFLSLGALCSALRGVPPSAPLGQRVVEAMTTHETSFFRDTNCFQTLREKILPELLELRAGSRRLAIWSAACSSGQEPYSLAMLLRESFPQLANWNVKIVATDISAHILQRAQEGAYNQLEVNRGLPATFLAKYFTQRGLEWKINDNVRRVIDFQRGNLLEDPPPGSPFDLILVRNVLIYFDTPAKRATVDKIRRVLAPNGYLMLGSTETLANATHPGDFTEGPCSGAYRRAHGA